jgi:hypothetical protein
VRSGLIDDGVSTNCVGILCEGPAKSAGNFLDMWAREGPGEGVSVAAPKTYVIDFRFLLD